MHKSFRGSCQIALNDVVDSFVSGFILFALHWQVKLSTPRGSRRIKPRRAGEVSVSGEDLKMHEKCVFFCFFRKQWLRDPK
jgi:hypothetical protein